MRLCIAITFSFVWLLYLYVVGRKKIIPNYTWKYILIMIKSQQTGIFCNLHVIYTDYIITCKTLTIMN